MSDFSKFAALVKQQLDAMSQHELFVTAATGDETFEQYLKYFPKGTNPVYRERTEHDCSCCKQFIRNFGNVVAIIDGKVTSVWDVQGAEHPYATVAELLNNFITAHPIASIFRASERQYGAEHTLEALGEGEVKRWNHFHGRVADRHFTQTVGKDVGEFNTQAAMFKRGLEELYPSAFDTVIDLVEANALYRGAEFLPALKKFQQMQNEYLKLNSVKARERFIWLGAGDPAVRFRNTVMGTLIQDLSADMPLEQAVAAFENKMSGTNYKRPTALITPGMIKAAMATIDQLGLESALERRFARLSDVSINNVLWVDNTVQGKMKDGVEGLLMAAAAPAKADTGRTENISIDDFVSQVLPQAASMELLIKNAHQGQFVSLTAPVHGDSGNLFKWGNDFGWSYNGNIADSIKEKVKNAGGNTNAVLRASLAWHNFDDLDLHAVEPDGYRIYFGNRGRKSPQGGGCLDVDMHVGKGTSRAPVENIFWDHPRDGDYQIIIHNYCRRETSDVGFTVEIENAGQIHQFSRAKSPNDNQYVTAVTLRVRNQVVTEVKIADDQMVGGEFSQEKWGVATEKFIKVNTLMKSPNYWDDNAVGNKHWFFMLDGCVNDAPTRGIYNEFLHSALEQHRKVFEVLGDKTKCAPTADQLSGVGFSSTRNDTVTVNVTGAKLRKTYNITF